MQEPTWNRRSFLKLAGSGAAAAAVAPAIRTGRFARAGKGMSPDEFRSRVRGPILSFPTPYKADFSIDYEAVRRIIGRGIDAGIGVVTLTAGNNQYDILSYDEIRLLTKVMVEAAGGKAVTIAAAHFWWTRPIVEYAKYAESVGADAVQIRIPTYGTEEGVFELFKAIAGSTRLNMVIHGQPSFDLMDRLAKIDTVDGFKEEYTIEWSIPFYQRYGEKLAIFAGGTKSRFLEFRPYGMQAYYSTFSTFVLGFAMAFWKAVQDNDQEKMKECVFKYDIPFFRRWTTGFWNATLEHFGVAKRYQRPPQPSFDGRQMAELKVFYDGLGLRPS
ncbi:MAG: dihydrodipicolinate synthase family protein [Acidobacteriota bacterium]